MLGETADFHLEEMQVRRVTPRSAAFFAWSGIIFASRLLRAGCCPHIDVTHKQPAKNGASVRLPQQNEEARINPINRDRLYPCKIRQARRTM
ncbi:hypothetical protein HK13_01485 [Acetobacter indonesiensis]|nr:hypothetical protein HK13_01485 [Acetobacter indonesiensis]